MQIGKEHLRIENDDRRLPDSKSMEWDMPYAMQMIQSAIQQWQIDTVSPLSWSKGGPAEV